MKLAILLIVSCATLASAFMNHPTAVDQCGTPMAVVTYEDIEQQLNATADPGDVVCPNSFAKIVTQEIEELTNTTEMRELDLYARYLCGNHCGIIFYNAIDTLCPNVRDEVLAVFCSQHFPIIPTSAPTYCVYAELYIDIDEILMECYTVMENNDTCPLPCFNVLTSASKRVGCCLQARLNNSVGFLRQNDANAVALAMTAVYEACNVEIPGPCEPAYVNGIPVYTDPPISVPATRVVPATTAMEAGALGNVPMGPIILGFAAATMLAYLIA